MAQRVLIIGSGGREHAMAYRMASEHVVVTPGNAGIAREFECLPAGSGVGGYVELVKKLKPDLVVVGPEEPLALGVVDALADKGIAAFGPSKACAQLEAQKSLMKEICTAAGVATAAFAVFDEKNPPTPFVKGGKKSVVVKADGLCAGKGVVICQDFAEAQKVAADFLGTDGAPRFGEASKKIVMEEFLFGKEVSLIGICDGMDVNLFAPVRDHKRLLDGNQGPNTGGMGVIGPIDTKAIPNFLSKVKEQVFLPILRQMQKRGTPYRGFLYAGLMVSEDAINVLEFNVRLGDPEAQALLFGTDVDLVPILSEVAKGGRLPRMRELAELMQPTAVVVMASGGYPETKNPPAPFVKGEKLGLPGVGIFYSGVSNDSDGSLVADGGRVLSVAAHAGTLALAREVCYQAVSQIRFQGAQFRKDIGVDDAII